MRKTVVAAAMALAVSACGSGSSKSTLQTVGVTSNATATLALGSMLASVKTALMSVTPARSAAAGRPIAHASSATVSVDCSSGSATATISSDTSGGAGTLSTSDTLGFDRCQTSDGYLDGSFTLQASVTTGTSSTSGTVGLDGSVAYRSADGQYAGDIGFNNLAITFDCSSTGCGTLAVTGSFTVGGVTYQLDPSSFASLLGNL